MVLLVRLYDGRRTDATGGPRPVHVDEFGPDRVIGFVILVLGTIVTGTGPHSGDAGEVTRIDMNPRDLTHPCDRGLCSSAPRSPCS